MRRKNSITKNYLYNMVYQVLMLAVPLITTPYISRVLGAEGIGTYSYSNSVAAYFTLFAVMGTTIYGQREIAYHQKDPGECSAIFWNVFLLKFFMTAVCSAAYLIYAAHSPYYAIYIAQIGVLLSIAFDVTWFFQGLEEFQRIVVRNTILKAINIIFIFAFVKDENDLLIYVVGITMIPAIGQMSLWCDLKNFLKPVERKRIAPFKCFRESLELFIPSVATQVYTVADKTMLGAFTVLKNENGYYEQSEKIVKLCLTLITSLGTVMIPRIAYTFAQKDTKLLQYYMYRAYRFVWFLGIPSFFGIAAIADVVVPWFLGPEFMKVSQLLVVFSFLILAIGLNNVTGIQYLIPTKKQNVYTVTVTIGAFVNLILNFFLIPRYYSTGAAVASVTAETVITVVQFVYVIHIEKRFSFKDIFKPSVSYWVCGIIMFGTICFAKHFLKSSLFSTLLLIGMGAAVYMGLLLLKKDELLLSFIERIKIQVKR